LPEQNSVTLRLQPSPDAAAKARRTLRGLCPQVPGHLLYDAELLTSEIVTNAVKHATGILTIAIDCDDHKLAVAVCDDSPNQPVIRNSGAENIGGRGMQLVDRLAAAWGCNPAPDAKGKVVWFRLAV
jgi:anti-sigma regulatory factor (Ser/Thr protein kinase)